MDAVKYLEERKRMCGSYNNMCVGCGFGKVPQCNDVEDYNPEEAVAIVEKWSAEHPVKTRQSEFLKIIPEADLREEILNICPRRISVNLVNEYECAKSECSNCKKKYWLEEVE